MGYAEQTMALQRQAAQQKSALDQQAMELTMEYQMKKTEEHMAKQQYSMEKQQFEMQNKMKKEMDKLGLLGQQLQSSYSMGQSYAPHSSALQFYAAQSYAPQSNSPTNALSSTQTYVYGPNGELIPKPEMQ